METYYKPEDLSKFEKIGEEAPELAKKFFEYYGAVFAEGELTEREKAPIAPSTRRSSASSIISMPSSFFVSSIVSSQTGAPLVAAILGVSRAATVARHRNGEFEPRLILPLSLSYDHRIVDGADAARFMKWITECLEQPFTMNL